MNQTKKIIGIIMIVLLLFFTACAKQTTQETTTADETGTSAAMESTMMNDQSNNETATSTATGATTQATSSSGVEEYTVKAFRFGYSPDTLTVKKGDLIKITIDNTDGMHGINLFDFRVHGMSSIEFTADKTGTFMWYCDNFCGTGHSSMHGTLTVE